jgi:hypothetical protein
MTRRAVITSSLLVLVLVAWGITPAIIQYFATQALLKAKDRGLQLDVSGLTGQRIGVDVGSLEGWVPLKVASGALSAIPLTYKLDDLKLRLKLLNWPPTQPELHLEGQGYGGTLSATVSSVLTGQRVDLNLVGVDLSSHPQLSAIGISAGRLSLTTNSHPLALDWNRDASYTLNLSDLRIDLPPVARDLTRIASVSDGLIEGRAVVKPSGNFEVVSCDIKSSLFSAKLTGRGRIARSGELSGVSGMLRVNLDQPDSQALAAWLPLITNQQVEPTDSKFGCVLQSGSCASAGRMSFRLGKECLRLICNP